MLQDVRAVWNKHFELNWLSSNISKLIPPDGSLSTKKKIGKSVSLQINPKVKAGMDVDLIKLKIILSKMFNCTISLTKSANLQN